MVTLAVVLSALILLLMTVAFILFLARNRDVASDQRQSLQDFSLRFEKELGELRQGLNQQLLDLTRQMNDQQNKSARFLLDSHKGYLESVEKVQHQLGALHQASSTMVDLGKDIASLHDILRSPKLRGGLGECFLEEILRQILPEDHFEVQYPFADGSKVDAVIKMGDGMIPVDAKFPLENFKRMIMNEAEDKQARKLFYQDVKKHIDAIAHKYIKPEERTFDFALMYIPAENVYYEIIIKQDQQESLSEYAQKKRVIPVSPNSFYAYLQAIARGLKGLRIERSALKILDSLGQLEADLKKIALDFEKLGSHLAHANTAFERTSKGLEKLNTRVASMEDHRIQAALIKAEPIDTASV